MTDSFEKQSKYKESSGNNDSLKFIPTQDRLKAVKSIKDLHKSEKEKLNSGKYQWVTIIPLVGKPYKTLRNKKNI